MAETNSKAEKKLTLAEAEAQLALKEKEAVDAAALVKEVRSSESKENIMNSLSQVESYCQSIRDNEFDDKLTASVRNKLKSIVKLAFSDNHEIKRQVAKKKTYLACEIKTIKTVMENGGNTSKDNAISKADIESLVREEVKVGDNTIPETVRFEGNKWASLSKENLKSDGKGRNKKYWIE